MKEWVILIIVYSGALEGEMSMVAMTSQESCEAAMDIMAESLFPVMEDAMIQCRATGVPVTSVRPKPRPDNLMEGHRDGKSG